MRRSHSASELLRSVLTSSTSLTACALARPQRRGCSSSSSALSTGRENSPSTINRRRAPTRSDRQQQQQASHHQQPAEPWDRSSASHRSDNSFKDVRGGGRRDEDDDGSLFAISQYYATGGGAAATGGSSNNLQDAMSMHRSKQMKQQSSAPSGLGRLQAVDGGATDVSIGAGADARARKHNVFIEARRAKEDSGEDLLRTMRTERLFPMVPRLEGLQANATDVNTTQMVVIRHPDTVAGATVGASASTSHEQQQSFLTPAEEYLHTLVAGGDGVPVAERAEKVRRAIDGHRGYTEEVLRGPDFAKTVSADHYLVPITLEPLPESDLHLLMKKICDLRGLTYDGAASSGPAPTLTAIQRFLQSGSCPPASIADVADIYEEGADFKSDGFAFVVYVENTPIGAFSTVLSARFGVPMTAISCMYTTVKNSSATAIVHVLPNHIKREHLLLFNVMLFQGNIFRVGNITALPRALLQGTETASKITTWSTFWARHEDHHMLTSSISDDAIDKVVADNLVAGDADDDAVGTTEEEEKTKGASEDNSTDDATEGSSVKTAEGGNEEVSAKTKSTTAEPRDAETSGKAAATDAASADAIAGDLFGDNSTEEAAEGSILGGGDQKSSSSSSPISSARTTQHVLEGRSAATRSPASLSPGKVFTVTTMLFRRVKGGSKEDIRQSMTWLKEAGAVNYQSASPLVLVTTRCLLHGDAKKAVLSLLFERNPPPLLEAFLVNPTLDNAKSAMRLKLLSHKLTILKNYVVTKGNFGDVLRRLPVRHRLGFSYTFNAFMLNGAMSARLRLAPTKVLVGDFVVRRAGIDYSADGGSTAAEDAASGSSSAEEDAYLSEKSSSRADGGMEGGNNAAEEEDADDTDLQASRSRFTRSEVHLVTSEEDAAQYSMADVVLPVRHMRSAEHTRDRSFVASFAPPNAACQVNTQEWLIKYLTQHGLEAAYATNALSEECQIALGIHNRTSASPCMYTRLIATPYKMSYEIFEDDVDWRLDAQEVAEALTENKRACAEMAAAATNAAGGGDGGANDHHNNCGGDGSSDALGGSSSYAGIKADVESFEEASGDVFSAEGFAFSEDVALPPTAGNSAASSAGATATANGDGLGGGSAASLLDIRGTSSEHLKLGAASLGEGNVRNSAVRSWAGPSIIPADSFRVLTTAWNVEEVRRCGLDKLLPAVDHPTNSIVPTSRTLMAQNTAASSGGGSSTSSSGEMALDAFSSAVAAFPNAPPLANGLLMPLRSVYGLPEDEHLRHLRVQREDLDNGIAPGSGRQYRGTEAWRGRTESGGGSDGHRTNTFVVWGSAKRRAERFVSAKPATPNSELAGKTKYFTVKLTFFEPPSTVRHSALTSSYLTHGKIANAAENAYQHDTHKNVAVGAVTLLRSVAATTRSPAVFDAIATELYSEIALEKSSDAGRAKVVVRPPYANKTRQRVRETLISELNTWRRDFAAAPKRYSTALDRTACDICHMADHTSSANCAVFLFHKGRKRSAKRAGVDVSRQRTALVVKEKQQRFLLESAVVGVDGIGSHLIDSAGASDANGAGIAGGSAPPTALLSFHSPHAAANHMQHLIKTMVKNLRREKASAEWTIVIDRDGPSIPWGFFAGGLRLTRIARQEGGVADGRIFTIRRTALGGDSPAGAALSNNTNDDAAAVGRERVAQLDELCRRLEDSTASTDEESLIALTTTPSASSDGSDAAPPSTITVYTISEVNALQVTDPDALITAVKNNIKVLDCEADPESRLRLTVLEHTLVLPRLRAQTQPPQIAASPQSTSSVSGGRRVTFADERGKESAASRRRDDDDNNDGERRSDRRSSKDDGHNDRDDDHAANSIVPRNMRDKYAMHAVPAKVIMIRRTTDARWGLNAQGLRIAPFHRKDSGDSSSDAKSGGGGDAFATVTSTSRSLTEVLLSDPSTAGGNRLFSGPPPAAQQQQQNNNKRMTSSSSGSDKLYYTDVAFILRGVNDVRVDTPEALHTIMGRLGRRVLRMSLLTEQVRLPAITIELDGGDMLAKTARNNNSSNMLPPIGFSIYGKGRLATLSGGKDTMFGRALLQQAPVWCNLRPDYADKSKAYGDEGFDDDANDRDMGFLTRQLLSDRYGLDKAQWRVESVNGSEGFDMRSLKDIMADLKLGRTSVRLTLRMVVPVAEDEE